jgi:hypothetical protein
MLTSEQIADIQARVDVRVLAEELGANLRAAGRKFIGSCPMCGGSKRSSRFEIPEPGRWVCAVCCDGGDAIRLVQRAPGCDFKGAIDRLGGPRALTPDEAAKLAASRTKAAAKRTAEAERYRAQAVAAAGRLWNQGMAPADCATSDYLAARGCMLPISAAIRHHQDVPYFDGETLDEQGRKSPRMVHRGPAMLAAVTDFSGQFRAIHITWLRTVLQAGALVAKAMIADPETGEILPAKKVRGSKDGGRIVLRSGGSAPTRLFIGEGIETVLSVATALRRAGALQHGDAFWSSVDLGNLGGPAVETVPHPTALTPAGRPQRMPGPQPLFEVDSKPVPAIRVPDSVTSLVLLGDGDSDPALTRTTLERAKARHTRPGLSITTAFAPEGMDFNDVLRSGS